jgi:cytochrome c oxidase assembly protein subunit 15
MLAVMVSLQVGLGLSNVYFQLPLVNAVAHNVGGALLVGILVKINFELTSFR